MFGKRNLLLVPILLLGYGCTQSESSSSSQRTKVISQNVPMFKDEVGQTHFFGCRDYDSFEEWRIYKCEEPSIRFLLQSRTTALVMLNVTPEFESMVEMRKRKYPSSAYTSFDQCTLYEAGKSISYSCRADDGSNVTLVKQLVRYKGQRD